MGVVPERSRRKKRSPRAQQTSSRRLKMRAIAMASGVRGPRRRGLRAQAEHPGGYHGPLRAPANRRHDGDPQPHSGSVKPLPEVRWPGASVRLPGGEDLPRGSPDGLRCYRACTPYAPIEDAPALTLFRGRMGYRLHRRRHRRRPDARRNSSRAMFAMDHAAVAYNG